jgi:hypothetical protein
MKFHDDLSQMLEFDDLVNVQIFSRLRVWVRRALEHIATLIVP